MKSSRKRFLQHAAAAATLAVPGVALAQARKAVRMAAPLSDIYGEPFFAAGAGAFQRHGFDLQVENIPTAATAIAGIVGGSLDMCTGDAITAGRAILQGTPIVVLAPGALYESANAPIFMVVAATSPVRTAHDLVGKTIGVPGLGALTATTLLEWLPKNGVDPAQVKLVEITQAATTPSLERGTIDCAVLVEPFYTINKDKVRILDRNFDVVAKEFTYALWFVSKTWVEADAGRAREFRTAIYETARWCNTHRDETSAVLARDAHIDPDIAKRMIRVNFQTAPLVPANIQPVLDFGTRVKIFDRRVDASSLIAKL
jgi:NitT/TauT family transport system substrate-binding protein